MEFDPSTAVPGEWADDLSARRPDGLGGLTEIRVHGVSSTPPSAMLGDPHPRQVGGDHIAGFYRTSDSPSGRHREAYSWGGLTSGARSRALWILMLPAMLANMAGWMPREEVRGSRPARGTPGASPAFQACARLAAIALTLTGAASTSYLSVDLLGIRWLASGCGDAAGVCMLSGRTGARAALGALLAAALAMGFSWLGRRSRNRYEEATCKGAPLSREDPPLQRRVAASSVAQGPRNRDFWATSPFHRRLSGAHLAIGLAVPAVVAALGSPLHPGRGLGAWSGVVAAAGLLAVLGALALATTGRGFRGLERGPTLLALVALAGAVVLGACAGRDDATASLRESADAVSVLWVSALALLLPLLLQQLLASRRWVHGEFFPWSAPVALAFLSQVTLQAVLLAVIALAGTWLRTTTNDVGPPGPSGPGGPGGAAEITPESAVVAARTDLSPLALTTVTALVAVAGALLLLLGVAFALGTWRVSSRTPVDMRPVAVRADLAAAYAERERSGVPEWAPPTGPDAPFWRSALGPGAESAAWVARVALARRVARVSRLLAGFLVPGSVLAFGVLAYGTALTLPGLRESAAGEFWAAQSVGPLRWIAWVPLALPPAALALLAILWRNRNLRRIIGVAFDVGTCLPRSFHPFAPPSYSERAVPELGERINRLVASGGRVVVAAHSQGSVLAAFVLARDGLLSPRARERIALVSYGSPLTKLYRWAFPTVFTRSFIDELARGIPRSRWRNVYYATDYIGGRVELSDPERDRALNSELVDPPTRWYVRGEPLPAVATHTGYTDDPALWREVDAVAEALENPAAAGSPP